MVEDVDNIAVSPRRLLNLAGQCQARHGHDVKGQPNQRLGVVEPLEEHAARSHRNLPEYLGLS